MKTEVIEFRIKGREDEPYITTFSKSSKGLLATCTCAAFEHGSFCKHRVRIILGTPFGLDIVSGTKQDVYTVHGWYINTRVEAVALCIARTEKSIEELLDGVRTLKAELSEALVTESYEMAS